MMLKIIVMGPLSRRNISSQRGSLPDQPTPRQGAEPPHLDAQDKALTRLCNFVRARTPHVVVELGTGQDSLVSPMTSWGVTTLQCFPEETPPDRRVRQSAAAGHVSGQVTSLPFAAGTVTGLVSRYATAHTAPTMLPTVFAEFARVLSVGGLLMLTCYTDTTLCSWPDGDRRVFVLPMGDYVELLVHAGFGVVSTATAPGGRQGSYQIAHIVAASHNPTRPLH